MFTSFKTLALASAFVAVGAMAAQAATVTAVISTGDPDFSASAPTGSSWSTEPAVVVGSTGTYASPFNDATTEYYTVGSTGLVSSPAVLTVEATDSFQLLWGTVDTYNAIAFFDENGDYDFVSGADLSPYLTVDGGTGAIVDITTTVMFVEVYFFSNFSGTFTAEGIPVFNDEDTPAFEFALATPAPVPVPAAGLLLLGGLGALGALRRRKAA